MLALNIKNTGLRLRTLGYFIIKEHVNAIIMVVVFNIACNVLVYHISNSIYISKLKEHKAPLVAKQVSLILLDILQQTNSLMRDVGESILQSDNDNLAEIYNILKDIDLASNNKFLSCTYFDWVDINNFQVINQTKGILKKPYDMSSRAYTWKSKQFPWTLQFSEPTIGIPSGEMVIPAGMGIVDNNKNFLGILVIGISIKEVKWLIEDAVPQGLFFILMDDNNNVLVSSSNIENDQNIKNKLAKLNKNYGQLKSAIIHKNIEYTFYQKVFHYPYQILIGFDGSFIEEDSQYFIISGFITTIINGGLFIVLVCLIINKSIKLDYDSANAVRKYLNSLFHRIKLNILKINNNSNILIRNLSEEIDISLSKNKELDLLKEIHNISVNNLESLYSSNHTKISTSLNEIILDSLQILKTDILNNSIIIRKNFEVNLQQINIDCFSIKHIVLNLLFKSIISTPLGSTIYITTYSKKNNEQTEIFLLIRDNGFGLNDKDMLKLRKNFPKESVDSFFDLCLDDIQKLAQANGVKLHTENKLYEGRTIILSFQT